MAVSRVKTWVAGEVLTASDLNSEFNNILNNGEALGSPRTGSLDLNGNELILDSDGDTSITADTDDQIDFRLGLNDRFTMTTTAFDFKGLKLILDADDDSSIQADSDDQIDFETGGADRMSLTNTLCTINTDTTINGTLTATSISGGVLATGAIDLNGEKLTMDTDGDTSLHADTDDQIDVEIGGFDDFRFVANSFLVLSGSNIDMDGNELVLDADGDTSITSDTDDQIDFRVGAADRLVLTNASLRMDTANLDLDGVQLIMDTDGDTILSSAVDDTLLFQTGAGTRMTLTNTALTMAVGLDLDGQTLVIDSDGDSSIRASADDTLQFRTGAADRAELTTTDFRLHNVDLNAEGNSLILDADADTEINSSVDDTMVLQVGGSAMQTLTATSSVFAHNVDLNGNTLVLDLDGDTSIDVNTDDVIDFNISGATDFRLQANSVQMLAGTSMSFNSSGDSIYLNGASLRLDTDDDTRIYASGDDTMDFVLGGTNVLSLTDDPKFSFHKQNNVREFAANHTLVAADNGRTLVFNTSAANRTLNLLAVATAGDGFWVHVKKESSSNTLILSTNSTETIDGNDGLTLESGNQAVTLVCDGAEWHVVNISSPIIQHVTAATATQASTASGTYQSSNLSASITPRKSGKVMAMASSSATVENTSGNTASMAVRLQNTTTATTHEVHLIAVGTGNATTNLIAGVVNLYGWETGLTVGTSYTFEVQFRLNTGTTAFIHTAQDARIFLMEVDV